MFKSPYRIHYLEMNDQVLLVLAFLDPGKYKALLTIWSLDTKELVRILPNYIKIIKKK